MRLFRFLTARRSGGACQQAVVGGIMTVAILLACTVSLGGDAPKSGSSQLSSGNAPTDTLFPSPVAGADATAEQAIDEIKLIRKRLGGSVLRGSLLDAAADKMDYEFDSGIRKSLEKPLEMDQALTPSRSEPMTSATIVSALREHGVELDRIANEIEAFRQYAHADQLRKTATAIRLIARHLDAEPGKARNASGRSASRSAQRQSK